ncbi:MAG: IS256 family transposase [Alphaproteobacteria bacterium]|nr:IS256 family transposase [Alphaproteobacteria bacterium]
MTDKKFNFDEALKAIQSGQAITGADGVLAPLVKQLTEAALSAELDTYLADNPSKNNRRNGYSKKTVKSASGSFELETPRDRTGEFEPQLVKKNQTKLSEEIDSKIFSLYSHGMSYRDIKTHIAEIYGLDLSDGAITNITDQLIPQLKEWQQRPLDAVYPFVWLDAIHFKIKEDGRYVSKAVYTILGLNGEGKKELLGLYCSESEGANYWLSVLTDLHNRGVQDIMIACVDGLKGFPEAIGAVFPETEVQLCVIHQIRNSLRYVASKDQKAFIRDLKPVYKAVTKEAAEMALDELEATWGQKYPKVIESWRNKWHLLSNYFKFPEYVRKPIYTTNAVEALHRQFRKLTKTKGAFPNENSLLKLLYIGIQQASKKWTMPISNWGQTIMQLSILFPSRLDDIITL